MASHYYGPLPQAEEDELHATRLLSIEERPFQRITNRLLKKDSILQSRPSQLPSPPPEGSEEPERQSVIDGEAAESRNLQTFREEIFLDFANLESSITRIQLIHSSNARERERYAAEKAKILATAQSVRENTLLLRQQLAEAQKVLELRKGYDEVALKILEDTKLKSRDECSADIATLEKEIEDLEAEGLEVEGLWVGRREQFEKVVHEGEVMRRVIKGIKEPEEEEEKGDEDDAMEDEEGEKEDRSRLGSAAPEDGRMPRRVDGGQTPMSGDGTPMHGGEAEAEGEEMPRNKVLAVEDAQRLASGAASPAAGDIEMGERSQAKASDLTTTDEPATEAMDES